MTDETTTIFRGDKAASVIMAISEMYNVSLENATDIYYQSDTSELIDEGVADLHCRSPRYLAQCVWDEYQEDEKQEQGTS